MNCEHFRLRTFHCRFVVSFSFRASPIRSDLMIFSLSLCPESPTQVFSKGGDVFFFFCAHGVGSGEWLSFSQAVLCSTVALRRTTGFQSCCVATITASYYLSPYGYRRREVHVFWLPFHRIPSPLWHPHKQSQQIKVDRRGELREVSTRGSMAALNASVTGRAVQGGPDGAAVCRTG